MVLKAAVIWKFCKTCSIYPWRSSCGICSTKCSCSTKCNFLGILEIFNITVQIWAAKCDFKKECFDYWNCDIDNYSFFGSHETAAGKNVNSNKLVVSKFHLTVHRFHARVQSSTCTTYGKYLRERIMALLTLTSGIM